MSNNGRIRDQDITTVRERIDLAEIVSRHVTLKRAGAGTLKGLCPFHDEKSPSFQIATAKGYYNCFGCGEAGDAISFLQKIEHMTFIEAVEHLADLTNFTLTYEGGGTGPSASERAKTKSERARALEANKAAAAFYAAQILTTEAAPARQFLADRGFDQDAALLFGVGYAPNSWDALATHLRSKGFTNAELITAGLCTDGRNGALDRFRGRVIWPIRDPSGETIGFGARKLLDTDDGPKYLNTPETILYKKSHVLFGLNLARKDIARTQQAVLVEGYTDVMACHLAGITTAVATCGTAFGEDHIRVLRRLLSDDNAFTGEVTFLFDGDSAGQKAALKAFTFDDKFQARTSVAVAAGGMDPCDLRLTGGDAALHALIAARQPLFTFAIRSILTLHNLSNPEGRVAALNQTAPIVAKIRDTGLRPEYTVVLAKWLGMDADTVRSAVQRAISPTASTPRPAAPNADRHADAAIAQRETLRALLQIPLRNPNALSMLNAAAFTDPLYQQVWNLLVATTTTAHQTDVLQLILSRDLDAPVRALIIALTVEALADTGLKDPSDYPELLIARLAEHAVSVAEQRIAVLATQVEADPDAEMQLMIERMALTEHRRAIDVWHSEIITGGATASTILPVAPPTPQR